jgi:hypothetical protein
MDVYDRWQATFKELEDRRKLGELQRVIHRLELAEMQAGADQARLQMVTKTANTEEAHVRKSAYYTRLAWRNVGRALYAMGKSDGSAEHDYRRWSAVVTAAADARRALASSTNHYNALSERGRAEWQQAIGAAATALPAAVFSAAEKPALEPGSA